MDLISFFLLTSFTYTCLRDRESLLKLVMGYQGSEKNVLNIFRAHLVYLEPYFELIKTFVMLEFQFSCVQFLFCFSLQTLRDSLDCMYDARIPTHWKKVYR